MITLWNATPAFDRVFDDVMRSAFGGYGTVTQFTPAVDVRSQEEAIVFHVDVPGVKRDDLTVTLEHRRLTIKGARKLSASEREQMSLGRAYGEFELAYTLPESIDSEALSADLMDGVLTIRVGKQAKAQPRRIQIGSGSEHEQLTE